MVSDPYPPPMLQDASDEIRSSIKAGSGGERHVGAVRISLSRQGLGRRAASLLLWCGVFLLLGLGVGGADDNVLNAKIVWREQKLLNCEKYFENSLKCKCFTFNPIVSFQQSILLIPPFFCSFRPLPTHPSSPTHVWLG